MIHLLLNSAVFCVKNANFCRFFGKNISKIITLVPETNVMELKYIRQKLAFLLKIRIVYAEN
jgi:hypothetical protein